LRAAALARALGALSICAGIGCSVDDLSYVGKTCTTTCPGSIACIDGICRKLDSLVYATDFRVAWATPNSIRWAWKLEGRGTDLVSYALLVTSPTSGASGAKTWTSADNLELGGYQIKNSNSFDIVTGTITAEMDPSTQYSAVLRLTDVDGHTFDTASVTAVTDVPRTSHLVVFERALGAGQYLDPAPPTFSVTSDGGVEGGPSLYYDVPQPNPGYQNLRIDSLKLRADSSLTDKLFAAAYVEVWIRGIGTPGSSWSNLWIRMYEADGTDCTDFPTCIYQYPIDWLYHPDPKAPGRYRQVQIPLSQFSLVGGANDAPVDGGALTREILVSKAIDEFDVGCPYGTTDTATYLDRIAIWW
jgi:hypothetical protein